MKFRGLVSVNASFRWLLLATAVACFCLPAYAATIVGTQVDNQADATYRVGGAAGPIFNDQSEVESFVVQEFTDVAVNYLGTTPQPVASPSQQTVLAYEVSHLGNGAEQYQLAFVNEAGDQFDTSPPIIYLDDGDQLFDPNTDTVYDPSQPPVFAAEQSQYVFVLVAIPTGLEIGDVADTTFTATAVSAGAQVGQPGTSIDGGGDNGEDLVIGSSGGQASAALPLVVNDNANLVLTKSVVAIDDPNGGNRPLPGSVITYRIEGELTGDGLLSDVVVTDAIPANTSYQAGSLNVNGIGQSDTQDPDAAYFDSANNSVVYEIGNLVAPGPTQLLEFQVTIK